MWRTECFSLYSCIEFVWFVRPLDWAGDCSFRCRVCCALLPVVIFSVSLGCATVLCFVSCVFYLVSLGWLGVACDGCKRFGPTSAMLYALRNLTVVTVAKCFVWNFNWIQSTFGYYVKRFTLTRPRFKFCECKNSTRTNYGRVFYTLV